MSDGANEFKLRILHVDDNPDDHALFQRAILETCPDCRNLSSSYAKAFQRFRSLPYPGGMIRKRSIALMRRVPVPIW
jgi:hypothetical protein